MRFKATNLEDCFFLQVKKLQVMLRQANDHLDRTMMEKQNLEDSINMGNEENAAKVWKR